MTEPQFHALVPGTKIPGDWYHGSIPENIEVGTGTVIDSSFSFKHYFAKGQVGLRIGDDCTIWRASFAAEEDAIIQVGDYSYIANAQLACHESITIGSRVFVAGGVTITDSNFHPLSPALRLIDTIALAPGGDRTRRPPFESHPVAVEDDVWIGYNATILPGVHVGAESVIGPGSVVVRDVPAGQWVEGNPATRKTSGTPW